MNTDEYQTTVDIKELAAGTSLCEAYTLERWMGQDGAGTFFAGMTRYGENLLVKLLPAQDPTAERQLARWERSRNLHHPHLLALRDVGSSELGGTPYVYAVFEYPDDVLASAAGHGPLSEAETRGVLEAALAALSYLHEQGLVHGAVTPDHIVAVGETVKLASDALRESQEPEAQAEDVRQLGELVRTLRAPQPLTDPLAAIVRRATAKDARKRWTLAEIANALAPPPPAQASVPVMAAPAATVRHAEPEAPEGTGFPRWIIAGVAILLFVILLFNIRPKSDAGKVAPAPSPVQRVSPPAPAAAPPSATPARNTTPTGPATWRVIAFTYRTRDMAAKKAKQINDRWPDLHAGVFRPKGLPGYFLVALGERTTREEATRLQRKARGLGLPRDTFVQNYNE